MEIKIYMNENKISVRLLTYLNRQEFNKYLVTHRELGFRYNRNSKSMEYNHRTSEKSFEEFVDSYINNLSNLFGEASLSVKKF